MSLVQKLLFQGWEVDTLSLQGGQGLFNLAEVSRTAENNEIRIPAKFGCAVNNAGLSADEQTSYVEFPERRKDFEDRVLDQGFPLKISKIATTCRIPLSFSPASILTILLLR